jgi:predicted NBD/HSP70 family sugar kinase/predicted transcriptional regulator
MESHTLTGKNQSYNRAFNNELVINALKEGSASATTLSKRLSLSNAAMSSILKDLVSRGLIKVEKATSLTGKGRKQIEYVLNANYGLVVAVSIANYVCDIVVSNLKENILESSSIDVPQYDAAAIYQIVLAISKILLKPQYRDIPLRYILISLPGRVNSRTGELAMSPQFDKEIFKSENFIRGVFQKQFPGVPVALANDLKLALVAERKKGGIVDGKNAMLVSVDAGIGGALSFNGSTFLGDQGYAGEFGLLHGGQPLPIDEYVSLRALKEQAKSLTHEPQVDTKRLVELFSSNADVKSAVLHSAEILGVALHDAIELLDISTIVLSGRIALFGESYLDAVKSQLVSLPTTPTIAFSRLGNDAASCGAITTAVAAVLSAAVEK